MSRRRAALLILTLASLAGCSDNNPVVSRARPGPRPTTVTYATPADLDAAIRAMIADWYPTGLVTSSGTRWTDIENKLSVGDNATARTMFFELANWIRDKIPQMVTPSDANGELPNHAATRLVSLMAAYVFQYPGPFNVADIGTGNDVVFGLVDPTHSAAIVTPGGLAGFFAPAGAAPVPFLLVISQNTTAYPRNCSGPLVTELCQYPQFYEYTPTPYVVLNAMASFAVCHVNAGSTRAPLPGTNHDYFRLAHRAPGAGYPVSGTISGGAEVLGLVSTPINCPADTYQTSMLGAPTAGFYGMVKRGGAGLMRFADALGGVLAPRVAYAIDQGGGGGSLTFSPFNDVDPTGRPDLQVSPTLSTGPTVSAGAQLPLTMSVSNGGTASSGAVTLIATLDEATTLTVTPALTPPDLAPGETTPQLYVTLPANIAAGQHILDLTAVSGTSLGEPNQTNNSGSMTFTVSGGGGGGGGVFGTATIDGVATAGEWNPAGCRTITVTMPSGGTKPGSLCVQNDASNLYVLVRIPNAANDPHSALAVDLGASATSLTDEIGYDTAFLDRYLSGSSYADDATANGSGAFGVNSGGDHGAVYELAHPLASGDAQDLQLVYGATFSLKATLTITSNSQSFNATTVGPVTITVASPPIQ